MTEQQEERYREVAELPSVRDFKVETLEMAGLHSVLEALHLPFGRGSRSETAFESKVIPMGVADHHSHFTFSSFGYVDEKDVKLLSTLVKNGDEEAKCIRGLQVYAKITAPRYWWQEETTYEVGAIKMGSNSTMHQECKGMSTKELVMAKEEIKDGLMQTRVHCFSYQTLRRIYHQRHNHRLPQWWVLCDWIKSLPYADEWITIERQ